MIEFQRGMPPRQVRKLCERAVESIEQFLSPTHRLQATLRRIAQLDLPPDMDAEMAAEVANLARGCEWPGAIAAAERFAANAASLEKIVQARIARGR